MSTREILRKKRILLDERRKLFDTIVGRINKRIDDTPVHITSIDYEVPEVIFGKPTFDMRECLAYVVNYFTDEGVHVTNLGHNWLRFDWSHLLRDGASAAPAAPRHRRFTAPSRPTPAPSFAHIERRIRGEL